MKKKSLLLLLVLISAFVFADEKEVEKHAVTIEDMMSMKSVGDLRMSPDGKYILYTLTTPDLKENSSDTDIYRVSVEGDEVVRMTTSEKAEWSPRWSPCGKKIAFLSSRDGKTAIYLMHAFGGEAEKISDHDESIRSYAWKPGGSAIIFASAVPRTKEEKEKRKAKKDEIVVEKNYRPTQLWSLDLKTKEIKQLTKGTKTVQSYDFCPQGKAIVYGAAKSPASFDTMQNTDIWLLKEGEEEATLVYENSGPDGSPRFSPDGKKIAFSSRDGKANPVGRNTIMVKEMESGEVKNLIAASFNPSIRSFSWLNSSEILFSATNGTKVHYFRVKLQDGKVTPVYEGDWVLGGWTMCKKFGRIAFTRQSPEYPADIFVADISEGTFGEPRKISDVNPQVKNWKLAKVETISWKTKDGFEVEGILTYPLGYEKGKKYHLVTRIHGGPSGAFTLGFGASMWNGSQYFAGRGWAMLMPNPRGSIGRGDKFEQANINDWGVGDYQDIIDGVDKVIEMGIADKDKLSVMGWSYGGYMTAWIVTQTDKFKAAAAGAGLTNLVSMYGTNDIPQVLERYFSGDIYGERLELYRERSPLTHVKNVKTPTLILQGQADNRVPIGQAQEFYYAIKKTGTPVELVLYPRSGHGPREINQRINLYQRWTKWFAKHTLGKEVSFCKEKKKEEKEEKK